MSWDKWHHDPREGEAPEELRYSAAHPLGRELTMDEMRQELDRVVGPVLARIRGLEQSSHRCTHGVNLERARCCQCQPIGVKS